MNYLVFNSLINLDVVGVRTEMNLFTLQVCSLNLGLKFSEVSLRVFEKFYLVKNKPHVDTYN